MTYRIDLHVHSGHSKDGRGSILELALAGQAAGLHGFAITDHDTTAGHAEIASAMEKTGLLIVPGIEVTSAEGHILAIGVERAIPKGQGIQETTEAIARAGGVAVAAHPLRFMTGIGPRGLEEHAAAGHLMAAEGANARERLMVQENTIRTIASHDLAITGGSDAHWIWDVGTAYTEFDHMPSSSMQLVQAIKDGLCRPAGQALPRRSVWGHSLSLAVPPLRRRFVR